MPDRLSWRPNGQLSFEGQRSRHAHHRLSDNDEGTVLRLLGDAGLANATKMAERRLWGFLRIVYYRAGAGGQARTHGLRNDRR